MAKTYKEVKKLVRTAIHVGHYKPNDRLPNTDCLASELNTSRLTVQRALQELASEGLVCRRPGLGTTVADSEKHLLGSVALLVPGFVGLGKHEKWMTAISKDLISSGLLMAPYETGGSVEKTLQIAQKLIQLQVSGVILAPPTFSGSEAIIKLFQDAHVPVVIAGKYDVADLAVSYVSSNHWQGGSLLGKHMTDLGHQMIATVAASHTQDAIERIGGFIDSVTKAGGLVPHDCRFEVKRLEEIPLIVSELFSRSKVPTAIFGANDLLAAEVMVALANMGIAIPEQCAVVGIDNHVLGKAFLSPLTTVDIPLEEEGHMLASVLLKTMRGQLKNPQHIELDCRLVVRESCGSKLRQANEQAKA